MKLNRRKFAIAGGTLMAAGGLTGLSGWLATGTPDASVFTGIPPANAAEADLKDLNTAPSIGERFIGNADAPVTIIEYASATCPHCADFHIKTFGRIKKNYIDTGKVKFIFREFPFDDLALAAFMVARCAPKDKFFGVLDILFEEQETWSRSKDPRGELLKIARLAGFSEKDFDACLKNNEIAQGIIGIRNKANKSYGINSTPTFFINGERLNGNFPYEKFKELIDAITG